LGLAPWDSAHRHTFPAVFNMPELPEVEVTRRSFADRIAGSRILGVRLGKPLRWPLGCDPDALVHLGMSGSLLFSQDLPPLGPHDHFEMRTTQGVLRLHDPRRFGAVVHASSLGDPVAVKLLSKLGMEPLNSGFEPLPFHQALRRRRSAIKQVLLAGDIVVGVGNIYASEALFLAGIRPTTRADRIGLARAARLHAAIVDVLQRAVDLGGSTLRDFSSAEGQQGYFQMKAMVYGRQGQTCRVCGSEIKAIRQGQRSTFFCPTCQRP